MAAADEAEDLELPIEPQGRGLAYREDGQILGFVGFEPGTEVEATGVVHPQNRRRGIGTVLLRALLDSCRENSVETCYLVIDEASPSGRGFVAHIGARYHISEYRMLLERDKFQPGASEGELELRPAGIEDLELFSTVLSQSFGTPLEENRAWLSADMRAPNRRFWMAWKDGAPIGTVRVVGFESNVYTTALAVLPEYRGRGHGRRILSEITQMLMDEHWEQILIEVETENRNALGLYRSIGYRETRTYGFYEVQL